MINEIIETYPEEKIVKADGFDKAVIGFDSESMRLIYSVKKCIKILQKEMSKEDALEYFEYNVRGTKGDNMPIWCDDNF